MFAVELFLLAAFCTWASGYPLHRTLLRCGIVDRPNQRSSHQTPTARGGGIAIIIPILAWLLLGWLFLAGTLFAEIIHGGPVLGVLFVATASLAVVSFVDDIRGISAAIRFGCHAAAAVGMVLILPFNLVDWPGSGLAKWIVFGVLFLWIAGYTNAFNFMDGINGLAAGQAVVTGLGTGLLVLLGLENWQRPQPEVLTACALAGAALGFLPHNFPRARMFMGDVSSAPLGFLLAALAVWCCARHGWWLWPAFFILHANFILDTGITLLRRICRGENWLQPHREHFYQRLIRAGRTHTEVTLWEMGLQLVCLALALQCLWTGPAGRLALAAVAVLVWLAFFAFAEFAFIRATRPTPPARSDPNKNG